MISSATLRRSMLYTPARSCPRCARVAQICKVWQKHSQTTAPTSANNTGGKGNFFRPVWNFKSSKSIHLKIYSLGIVRTSRMPERQSPRWGRTTRWSSSARGPWVTRCLSPPTFSNQYKGCWPQQIVVLIISPHCLDSRSINWCSRTFSGLASLTRADGSSFRSVWRPCSALSDLSMILCTESTSPIFQVCWIHSGP